MKVIWENIIFKYS